jgi:hypothetical protein
MISMKNVQPSEGGFPFSDNRGKRWTSEEDYYLVKQIPYMTNYEIGRNLKRSENAVYSRIKKLAFHMIQSGEDPEFVKNSFRLSEEDIDQINSECFVYNQKNNQNSGSKFITSIKNKKQRGYFTAPAQQSPEMSILIEIRSMLRRLLLQNETKGTSRTSTNRESPIDASHPNAPVASLNAPASALRRPPAVGCAVHNERTARADGNAETSPEVGLPHLMNSPSSVAVPFEINFDEFEKKSEEFASFSGSNPTLAADRQKRFVADSPKKK